jgi:hypothetical protein
VKDRAKAFDSVPILTIKKLKAKWPIKLYCEQILKLTFSRDFKTKCPFHNGDSDTTFVIDPKTGRWTCFGGCEPEPGREFATGDVIDLHQRAFNLPILVEALKSLQALAPNAPRCAQQCSLTQGAHTFFPDPPAKLSRPAKKIDVDSELVRQALERCSHVGRCQLLKRSPISNPTANDFASFLLDSVLQPDDKPIVFVNKKWPIMGAKARKRLTEKPEELQYLCSSISKRALRNKFNPDHGTTRARNLKERIFLDVEFDHEPNLDNQLRLLWG